MTSSTGEIAKHSAHVGYDDEFIYFMGELSSFLSGAVWLKWPLAFVFGKILRYPKDMSYRQVLALYCQFDISSTPSPRSLLLPL